jgi:hypothetical protein
VPFLWVLPLALYLLTFIICFDQPRWYVRGLFMPLLAVSVLGMAWMIDSLDREATKLGVTRQSVIKIWLAERLEARTAKTGTAIGQPG